ncbi:MAG: potassium channel protein [Peptococcaceae bacterium]|nr:potassium channel protein [Peptococcaceae bacterium]
MSRSFIYAFTTLTFVLVTSTAILTRVEGWSFLDTLWLVVVSITTVGYGDLVPQTIIGRITTLFLILSGVGLFTYVLSNILIIVIEGRIKDFFGGRRMERQIAELRNHIIVCGLGRVGAAVAKRLEQERVPFVGIERDPSRLQEFQQQGLLVIAGDATEDEILQKAGVSRARAVITTLPDDAGNVFITITCKDLNPNIKVITRSQKTKGAEKLYRAGADTVISPAAMAGNRMVLTALKPSSVEFIKTLVGKNELVLEEIRVSPTSYLVGKPLKESRLREDFAAQLLVIKRGDQNILAITPEEVIQAGDILILFGTSDKLSELKKAVTNHAT